MGSENGWREVKLGEVCEFQEGYVNPSQKIPDYFGDEIKWIRANDLNNGYVFDTSRKLSLKGFNSAGKSALLFEPDTIVISKSGTIGRLGIIKDFMCGNRATINIKTKKEIADYKYIFYHLLRNQSKIEDMAVGSVQRNLYTSILGSISLILPPLIEQKAIADTLSCLDDKIELNNRINKTLEEMAQAIFKSWFVDFEPFQDGEFEESELGRIPRGWRAKALYDFAEYINGTSFKKDEYVASGCPIIKITELKNGITSATEYFSGTKDEKYYIKTGDILFSWSGNPQTSIDTFIWVGGHAILNQHTFKISIKNNDYSFIYLLLKFFKPEFTRIASSKQTTGLGHVTIGDIKRLKFPCNDKVISEFCNKLNPVIQMYVKNLLENEKLCYIRDLLLPKLMSGEIRVTPPVTT